MQKVRDAAGHPEMGNGTPDAASSNSGHRGYTESDEEPTPVRRRYPERDHAMDPERRHQHLDGSASHAHRAAHSKHSLLVRVLLFASDHRVTLLTGTAIALALAWGYARVFKQPSVLSVERTDTPALRAESESLGPTVASAPAAAVASSPNTPAADVTNSPNAPAADVTNSPNTPAASAVASPNAPAPDVASPPIEPRAAAVVSSARQPVAEVAEPAPRVVPIASTSSRTTEAVAPAALASPPHKTAKTTSAATTGPSAAKAPSQTNQPTSGAAISDQAPTETQNQPKRRRAFKPEGI